MKTFLFLFATILFLQSLSSATASLEETCQKAKSDNVKVDYKFCIASLQVDPASQKADTKGLAIIATNLAKSNFTHNLKRVKELFADPKIPRETKNGLHDCLSCYEDGISELDAAIGDFKSGNIDGAGTNLSKSIDNSLLCQSSLEEFGGKSLMPKENEDASRIGYLALFIENLLEK